MSPGVHGCEFVSKEFRHAKSLDFADLNLAGAIVAAVLSIASGSVPTAFWIIPEARCGGSS